MIFWGLGCLLLVALLLGSVFVAAGVYAALEQLPETIRGGAAVLAGGIAFFGISHLTIPLFRAMFPKRFAKYAADRVRREEAAMKRLRAQSAEEGKGGGR